MEIIELSKSHNVQTIRSQPAANQEAPYGPVRTVINVAFGMAIGQVGWMLATSFF